MPETSFRKGSSGKSIWLRFITVSTATPAASVDENTPGLELWYERMGNDRTGITPAALTSPKAPYKSGGIEPISDGYTRIDLPDEALDFGADVVLVGGSADDIVAIGVTVKLLSEQSSEPDTPTPGRSQRVECDVLLQEAPDATHENCPINTKRRHIPVPKGVYGTAVWTMRLPSGLVANFAECTDSYSLSESASIVEVSDEKIMVRFQGCDRGPVLAEVEGDVIDAANGLIQFQIPPEVCQHAGIYQFQAALVRDTSPVFIDGGLISVEHGLWGDTIDMLGPPTIQEIRFHLKDRAVENDLLQAVEFDDAEILEAIRWPVFHFNEVPPTIRAFNCNTFPFRYHWRQAIVSHLLKSAVHHYVRNKMQAAGAGLTIDDKNKNDDYLRIAKMYSDEWDLFIVQKKVELNAADAWGSQGSSYGGYDSGY